LQREVKARRLDVRLAAEAKKAREQLTRQVKALREQGRKLASELKSTLGDADKRKRALNEARGKITDLRAQLARKTNGLKRKSEELKKLAAESAHRAAEIMRGDGEPAIEPAPTEPTAPPEHSEPGPNSSTDEPNLT
jgi:DNA anti-recombination protein RmuC